uniref:DUF6377 domain-containing protein n=1 Tax=Alloprevotella sp. TaxID=1872471 RepID=UPI003FEEFD36
MKRYILLTLILSLFVVQHAQSQSQPIEFDEPTQSLLCTLDDVIMNHKMQYREQRLKQINQLKAQARSATGYNKYNLYKEIFDLYSHFQTDSAQVYICKMRQLPAYKTDVVMQATLHIAQAEIMAVSALYAEALNELDKVPRSLINAEHIELRLYYYRIKRTIYGWMCTYYTKASEQHQLWEEKTMNYRDSLLSFETIKNLNRDIVLADKYNALGQPQKAINMLKPYAAQASEATPHPYVCFTLAQAYLLKGNRAKGVYYLTLTAIADLHNATCEYQALPMLAQILFDNGDVERAYSYLLCSMEDASYCKAGLRSIEASNIFPIIDKQYKQREKEQRQRDHVLMYALVALSFVLIGVVLYLRKQMQKLREMRHQQTRNNAELAAANQRMHEANEKLQAALQEVKNTNEELQNTYSQLRMTDKVKEEYIARYLNRCRMYLDQLAEFRSSTLRLIKNRHFEEVANQLKRDLNAKVEQTQFYADFDAAFLTLFPDFVSSFNALLQPEHQLTVKKNGLLNTELRIYALIRLGIHDTTRIAHFLDYSTATVYNYRSKIRNKAICPPEEFEELVGKL